MIRGFLRKENRTHFYVYSCGFVLSLKSTNKISNRKETFLKPISGLSNVICFWFSIFFFFNLSSTSNYEQPSKDYYKFCSLTEYKILKSQNQICELCYIRICNPLKWIPIGNGKP